MITEALANSNKLDIFSKDLLITETAKVVNEDVLKYLPDLTNQKSEIIFKNHKEGKFNEAIQLAESIKNRSNEINFILAISFIEINNYIKAKEILDLIEPQGETENYFLGIFYCKINEIEKSIHFLEKHQGKFQAHTNQVLGIIYRTLSKSNLAINAYKKSIELGNDSSLQLLISLLMEQEQLEEAEKYYEIGTRKGIKECENEFINGLLYSNGQEQKCQLIIDTKLQEQPENPYLNHFKGLFVYMENEDLTAYKLLKKANSIFKKEGISDTFYFKNIFYLLEIQIKKIFNKDEAINTIKEINQYDIENNFLYLYISFVKIWNHEYKEGIEYFLKEEIDSTQFEFIDEKIRNILLLLLAKKQYHSVLKIFNDEKLNLKEKMKPIYYALMIYLKEEFPNEHIKMGEELKQPVNDIMKRIDEMAITYV